MEFEELNETTTHQQAPGRTLSPLNEYVFTMILYIIHYILDPIVLSLGLVGNILAFLVLLQPQYRSQTTCLYMRILAVFDTSIILLKNVQRTALMWNPDFFISIGKWFCPPYWFFSANFYGISNWVVLCMTFDRFIAVCFPLKAATWCTKRRAKISAVLILLTFASFNFPNFFTVPDVEGMKLRLGRKTCAYIPKFVPQSYAEIKFIVFSLWSLGIPLLGVMLLNFCIVAAVYGRREKQEQMGVQKADKNNQALVLLFIVTGVFLSTNLPWIVDNLVWTYILKLITGRRYQDDYYLYRLRPVIYESVLFLVFTNSSINFYLYCMGCKKFRKDLVTMMKNAGGACRGKLRDKGNNSSGSEVTITTKI